MCVCEKKIQEQLSNSLHGTLQNFESRTFFHSHFLTTFRLKKSRRSKLYRLLETGQVTESESGIRKRFDIWNKLYHFVFPQLLIARLSELPCTTYDASTYNQELKFSQLYTSCAEVIRVILSGRFRHPEDFAYNLVIHTYLISPCLDL